MKGNILRIFRFIVLLATLCIATLAMLYVLELFTDELLKELVEKTLKITGIAITTALLIILLMDNRQQ